MSDELDDISAELAEDLRTLLGDPIPADAVARSQALWTWRTIDAELLDLEDDAVASPDAAGVRDGATVTTLSFVCETDLAVEVEFDAAECTLVGQLLPPQPARVTLQSPRHGERVTDASVRGVFGLSGVPTGPIRLIVERSAGLHRTRWVLL